jgi:hypothetical protein
MSMMASSRERKRSICPLSRRSFGRILPSDATTEPQLAIRRNPKNEIASFWGLKLRGLAISMPSLFQKIDSSSRAWEFFTDDECVYLHTFETGSEAKAGIGSWISNGTRPHSALNDKTAAEAYAMHSRRQDRGPPRSRRQPNWRYEQS